MPKHLCTVPISIPPEILRELGVPSSVIWEPIEYGLKVRSVADLVPAIDPVKVECLVNGRCTHLQIKDAQEQVDDEVVIDVVAASSLKDMGAFEEALDVGLRDHVS
jgi:hypothetical protein